jgi:hypothetical protein
MDFLLVTMQFNATDEDLKMAVVGVLNDI